MNQIPFRPVVRAQSDVEEMWRRLMSPLGFTSSSLWIVFIEGSNGRPFHYGLPSPFVRDIP